MTDRETSSAIAAPDFEASGGSPGALSFGEAMRHLEVILRRVETEEIDIDDLAAELRRASALLETARAKIARAELEVAQIVSKLESEPGKDDHG